MLINYLSNNCSFIIKKKLIPVLKAVLYIFRLYVTTWVSGSTSIKLMQHSQQVDQFGREKDQESSVLLMYGFNSKTDSINSLYLTTYWYIAMH